MCVILTAAKKRHVTKEEILAAMKKNGDGFFMMALRPDGTRETIRTMMHEKAVEFFDKDVSDEDAFVMHARIRSKGDINLDNVHGWEHEGWVFSHNGTLRECDSMMNKIGWKNTDSEFFFRKIFAPLLKGLGEEAYKDGKFHPVLDYVITHFIGPAIGYGNKFCFISPDNKIIRYGSWEKEEDRKEGGEIAFWASNTSYRPEKGGVATNVAGFRGTYKDDEYEFSRWQQGRKSRTTYSAGFCQTSFYSSEKERFSGQNLLNTMRTEELCVFALSHLVIEGVLQNRRILGTKEEEKAEKEAQEALKPLIPRCFDGTYYEVYSAFSDMLDFMDLEEQEAGMVSSMAATDFVNAFVEKVASIYEHGIVKEHSTYAHFASDYLVEHGLQITRPKIKSLCRILNIALDFDTEDPEMFARSFIVEKSGFTNSVSSFDALVIDMNDILDDTNMTISRALDGIQLLLIASKGEIETHYPMTFPPAAVDMDDTVDIDETDNEMVEVNESLLSLKNSAEKDEEEVPAW